MGNSILESQFEAQLEELNDRLHECLQAPASDDAEIARQILEGLILGYQEQLSELRQRGRPTLAMD
jgi:sugar (pentulose or hexulose) kinase